MSTVRATEPVETKPPQDASLSLWQAAFRRMRRRPTAIFSMIYIALVTIVALFATKIAPYSYETVDYDHVRANPGTAGHLLGTDTLGRDILSRMIYGARVSMSVALVVLLIGVLVGLTLGCIAGYYGGWVDMAIMRLTDIMFAFPELLLAILIMGIRGAGIGNIFFALGIVAWPGLARLVRGQVLSLKEAEFVQAARSLGNNDLNIIIRHLLPNLISPVLVSATLGLAGTILAEASLSFLGIGVKPPYPSWGSILNDMVTMIYSQPKLLLWPSVILATTVLAFNFLGDALRDALDPRLKR